MANINRQIAEELGVREQQVEATVTLLDGGATVPFMARYRKEITGALDDAQLRTLEERLNYLRELEERRTAILNSVREQGKLDAALEAAILAADSKGRLEDIYLPFKPKRRTKAEIAREAGLEPLADLLLTQPQNDPADRGRTVRRCRKAGGRCRRRARRRARDSGRTLRRGCRPDRRAARADVVERPAGLDGAQRQEDRGREVQRTISISAEPLTKLPSHRILAHVPRREGRDPRSADAARAESPRTPARRSARMS